MRTATMIAAAVAAGVVGAGAVVTPVVLAAQDDPPRPAGPRWDDRGGGAGPGERGPGYGPGRGMGMGQGPRSGMGMGQGPRTGVGGGMGGGVGQGAGGCHRIAADAPSGELTAEQEDALAHQAELEKLSHDVYLVFAEDTGDHRFRMIAQSETQHLEAVRTLLERYDVEDPTEGLSQGEFSGNAEDRYDAYLEAGSDSVEAALETAQEIEQEDIEGLEKAAKGLDAPDVEQAYEHLTRASEMHLWAFSR